MAITDKQRIDFLSRQNFTRWVGYDTKNGSCVWPVFGRDDLRAEIDKAIKSSAQHSVQATAATPRKIGTKSKSKVARKSRRA